MAGKGWPTGINPSGAGYRIRIWKKGRVCYQETVPGKTKAALAEAVRRRQWLIARLRTGLPLAEEQSEGQLFREVAQDYLETLEARDSTIIEYHRILNNWWMALADHAIADISPAQVKRILSSMEVSTKTKKNRLIPLYGVFNHAEIRPPRIRLKRQQSDPVDRYSPGERQQLLSALDGQARVYFTLLFGVGLRPGEALALQWIDYDGEYLNVTKSISKRRIGATKTGRSRRIYVPRWARESLDSYRATSRATAVFYNSRGRRWLDTDYFNGAWKQAHSQCGIRYRIPYTCRHTRAAELLSAGVIPARAAKELGHSVEMFLRVYSEFIEEYAETDMSQFEGVRNE